MSDLTFCNKLHINNFIIPLSARQKKMGRQAKSNLFLLQSSVESTIQMHHNGYARRNMRPIHSEKIRSEPQRQVVKPVLMQEAVL